MVKNRVFVVLVAISSIFLWGCPYESEVPLSKQKVALIPGLMGNWAQKENGDDRHYYIVEKLSDKEYKVTQWDTGKDDKKYYKAFISELKGHKFLNLSDYNESGQSYTSANFNVFLIAEQQKNSFKLKALTDNIREKFKTSEEFAAFVEKNMNVSYFYDKEELYFQKK